MDMNDIISTLQNKIPESEIKFVSEGAKMKLKITAKIFTNMTRLERQRYVKVTNSLDRFWRVACSDNAN